MFAYYKNLKNVRLRMFVKRDDLNEEEMLFEVAILNLFKILIFYQKLQA